MSSCPTFETERLLLREVTRGDIPTWQEYLRDEETRAGMYKDSFLFNPESLFPLQGKTLWVWGIFLKSDPDRLIGMAWLRHPGTPTNRGFWLAEEHRGKGLMTEVLAPVMEYAFTILNLERVLVGNAVGNTKSRRIKEKSGAVLIRTEAVPPGLYVNPEYKEREIWELTKERWLASKLGDSQPRNTDEERTTGDHRSNQ